MHSKQQQVAGLLLALLAALAISCAASAAVRMQAVHTDAGRGLSRLELLQRMAMRSTARAARLLTGTSASAPVTPGSTANGLATAEYLMHFAIGTPPQAVQLILATGSDLIWTQCKACNPCYSQPLPYFDPSLSSTLAELACDSSACQALLPASSCGPDSSGNQVCVYSYSYGDHSVTNGFLDVDTFTFSGDATVPGLAFGCGLSNTETPGGISDTGVAGFGRGHLSLPAQLTVDNFSHCFTLITGATPSPVLLGLPANLYSSDPAAVQTTPFVQNPSSRYPFSSFYYVPLQGITVGSSSLSIPESNVAPAADGTGGTFIDSGTAFTRLPKALYKFVQQAFIQQVNLPVYTSTSVSQLCFSVPAGADPEVPKLMFQFDGAVLDLPVGNYMFPIQDGGVTALCLAINGADDSNSSTIIIGNYQQQNLHVLYDLVNNNLSFVPAQCDQV